VHVRRALLLFAIVLGVAALAAAVSQPRQETREARPREQSTPPITPARPSRRDGLAPLRVDFPAEGEPRTKRLGAGLPATVTVQVSEPGEVALEGLGLDTSAEPLTPARFEVLAQRPARHRVRFTPAGHDEATTVGTLAIVAD
jgi:hypothetical protein